MFRRFRRPAPRPLSDAILRAIEQDGMSLMVGNPSRLQMVESRGRYSDRTVTYFRIFDPTSSAQAAVEIRRYQDFDVFAGRILGSGHVERDGTVVLTRPAAVRPTESLIRPAVNPALHADDTRSE